MHAHLTAARHASYQKLLDIYNKPSPETNKLRRDLRDIASANRAQWAGHELLAMRPGESLSEWWQRVGRAGAARRAAPKLRRQLGRALDLAVLDSQMEKSWESGFPERKRMRDGQIELEVKRSSRAEKLVNRWKSRLEESNHSLDQRFEELHKETSLRHLLRPGGLVDELT